MKSRLFLFLLLLLLFACRDRVTNIPIVTPPILEDATPLEKASATVALEITETVVPTAEPETLTTPVPTSTIVPATPTTPPTTPTPADTPRPASGRSATSIQLAPVVESGLRKPLYLTHAFDERLFVVEQGGSIRIIEDGELRPEPFLDISNRAVMGANEQGLLGLAFHPQYALPGKPGSGRFFVNYTDRTGDTVVSSFRVTANDPNRADPDSEEILFTLDQPYPNHNGGQVAFGPDGFLYVGLGDGGSAEDPQGNGQDPSTLLGTILRLSVDEPPGDAAYAIPADNPFVLDDGKRNEIWAYGLRNPWRFSFDRLTGDLYIADVGQNTWEEVHFQEAGSGGGENYGWNMLEGSHCFLQANCDTAGLKLPIFEYDHSQGCSITGGYVYRGVSFPALNGNYFFADYCTGTVWSLFRESDGRWTVREVLQAGFLVSSFGQDTQGEVYLLDHGNGRVFQIQP